MAGHSHESFMTFSTLGLADALLRAVSDQGYSTPTPIQAKAIPAVLAGSDVLAAAQTGTGKTAGFVLPILHRLGANARRAHGNARRFVRALILVPTRELAAQVEASVQAYGRHLPLASATVIGGASLHRQAAALRRGVDILVATPGRLLDHHAQRNVDLSRVETLVLDEADRMLDMGFIRDIRRVIAALPEKRQNLLFSATFSDDIKALARSLLDRPVTLEVGPTNATVDVIDQVVHPVEQGRKRALLSLLIGRNNWQQVLVFTRTKHGADRLTRDLNVDGIDALAIHGNKNQNARTRALAKFKGGDLRVLVATDIAARGIDIDQLPHVVNFDLPNVPQDYVHRIGRTGRAGAAGQAVSLVSREERGYLRDIESLIRKSIRCQPLAGFESHPEATPQSPPGRAGRAPTFHARREPAATSRAPDPAPRGGRRHDGKRVAPRDGAARAKHQHRVR
jgi:ATP-dependent RNA helicase RhlE